MDSRFFVHMLCVTRLQGRFPGDVGRKTCTGGRFPGHVGRAPGLQRYFLGDVGRKTCTGGRFQGHVGRVPGLQRYFPGGGEQRNPRLTGESVVCPPK